MGCMDIQLRSSNEIADEIAGQFFEVGSLAHADLGRQIMRAIEAERKIARHNDARVGRWACSTSHSMTVGRQG